MGYLQYRLGKVAEEAEFMMNKLDTAAQIEMAEISFLERSLFSLSSRSQSLLLMPREQRNQSERA